MIAWLGRNRIPSGREHLPVTLSMYLHDTNTREVRRSRTGGINWCNHCGSASPRMATTAR